MPSTYNDIYLDARKKLRQSGIEAFSLEARLIVACAAGKTMDAFLRELNLYTSSEVAQKVDAMVEKRLQGEPVAYITGSWEFYGMPMAVNRSVLIPRADTETLLEAVVSVLKGRKMDARILDLCTGSGCIGCAIARELPATRVVLADNSQGALGVAKQNVMKNKLNPRVTCIDVDVLEPPPMMLGSFDVLVSNPPYIPTADLEDLDRSVKDYEPVAALDGGEDGLEFYRSILEKWLVVIRVGGILAMEVGIDQAETVMQMMRSAGIVNVGCIKDTGGIDRVVYGNV